MKGLAYKRIGASILAAGLSLGFLSACGNDTASGLTISIFNSKVEIQDQMEEMAEEYSKEKGVNVEIYYSSDTVSAHLATKYASNDPYTIAMVDAKDVYSLAQDHAIDLSDESWVSDTDYAISIDGKVYGFPVSIESTGFIYNADAIEKITGTAFNPDDYTSLDDFKTLLAQLRAGGMENPVAILKEDWSLAAHYLPQVYDEQEDAIGFLHELHDGTVDLNSDAKFTSIMNTFDVLMEYNYAKASPIAAEREVSSQKLAEGEVAFMFGGNWDWAVINQYDYTEHLGIMALPKDIDDKWTTTLHGGGSKYLIIDSSENTSDEQRQAAKDFLTWYAEDPDGQSFAVNDCSLVSPFKSNTLEVSDPLGSSIKKYADAGQLEDRHNYLPDDHYSVLGADFQKYLAGESTRAEFAAAIESYWKTATLAQ